MGVVKRLGASTKAWMKRPLSQIHSSLTAMFSRATMRRSWWMRASRRTLQPCEQCVQIDFVRFELPGAIAEAAHAVGERAHRAEVDDVAAGLGVDRLLGKIVDDRLAAAVIQAELRLVLPLLEVTDTAPADDAALLVEHDQVADRVAASACGS